LPSPPQNFSSTMSLAMPRLASPEPASARRSEPCPCQPSHVAFFGPTAIPLALLCHTRPDSAVADHASPDHTLSRPAKRLAPQFPLLAKAHPAEPGLTMHCHTTAGFQLINFALNLPKCKAPVFLFVGSGRPSITPIKAPAMFRESVIKFVESDTEFMSSSR